MNLELHVLASGSSGNATLVRFGDFGILIDFGINPRQLARRFQGGGSLWNQFQAVLLTHVHGDHWQESSLAMIAEKGIPLYLHASHAEVLDRETPLLRNMREAGLLHFFELDHPLTIHGGCQVLPFALSHDAETTCGFRLEGGHAIFGASWSIAYAADLGCWRDDLLPYLRDVEILALEFNHDVKMQMESARPPFLIRRVLGNHGHLSNLQAAKLVEQVLATSTPARLQHLVQLHLSQECNQATLARAAVADLCQRANVALHTSDPCGPGPVITLGTRRIEKPRQSLNAKKPPTFHQPSLFADWE